MLVVEFHASEIGRTLGRPLHAAAAAAAPLRSSSNGTKPKPAPDYTVGEALQDLRFLEEAGFMLHSTELVCGPCGARGQLEMALVNVSWLREGILAGGFD